MDFHYDIDFIFPNDEPPFDSSSDDDEMELTLAIAIEELKNEGASTSRRRSVQPRRFIWRNPLQGHDRLFHDYFVETPVYPPNVFRRRFRMSRSLFLRIHSRVEATEPYFVQKRNAANTLRLSSLQKMTAAIRMLAYGVSADFMDEYIRIGETTAIKSLKKFVKAVVSIFSEEYLRSPNNNDIARLLAVGQHRGFPGMLGSINCMHWKLNNCPNGIYPSWATFVKTILAPQDRKRQHFASAQEAVRKDVERAFGVLQARFAIVRGPTRFFHLETLKDIMMACIILHNMIVEDE
ncbi:uncharacterized protein LOC126704472 [Quercus robur]|uniref:uncharacterized protein LOC126704472 n=1 Tax=Quercus robur TaxID=38942 RepID=UPI002161C805|nr:uncharacterized protein LOC126704472 [Quercus robur]